MDHTHDAAHICQTWSDALPEKPKSWDDGLCGPLIAHLLFSVEELGLGLGFRLGLGLG